MEFHLPALPEKDFFSMGEASRLVQLPAHTLRYWEGRIGLLKPARRSSGHRRYARSDLETILFIKEMVQRRKMTVAGARKALIDWRKGAPASGLPPPALGSDGTALKLLREIRRELQQMVRELQ